MIVRIILFLFIVQFETTSLNWYIHLTGAVEFVQCSSRVHESGEGWSSEHGVPKKQQCHG